MGRQHKPLPNDGQRPSIHAALAEFESVVKIALDDLSLGIGAAVSGVAGLSSWEIEVHENDEDTVIVDRLAFKELTRRLEGADDAATDVLDNFSWRLERALKGLKKALAP
jgi:hypothetical protein